MVLQGVKTEVLFPTIWLRSDFPRPPDWPVFILEIINKQKWTAATSKVPFFLKKRIGTEGHFC